MAAQKFTRKELKKDPFIFHTERVLAFIQSHATAVGMGLIVLIVLLVGSTYVRQGQKAARHEASYLLYLGQNMVALGDYLLATAPLEECIEKHGRTDFSKYARVSLVQALLGAGETAHALKRAEKYLSEISDRHPAGKQLAIVHAYALADNGMYTEAARALEQLTTPNLAPSIYYDRMIQRAQWLELAGAYRDALQLLTELQKSISAGEIMIPELGNDLEQRLEVIRALAR